MNRTHKLNYVLLLAFSGVLLAGCGGGFRLRPVAARGGQPGSVAAVGYLSSVQVLMSAELQADKVQMLMNYNVPGEMQRVLTGIGMGQTPFTAQVYITQFRNGFGPARMHTRTIVYDQGGAVVRDFEAESLSLRGGSKGARLLRITQHNVQSIADGL